MSRYGDGLRDAILMLKSAGYDEAAAAINGVAETIEASNSSQLRASMHVELDKWFEEQVTDRPDGEYGEEATFGIRLIVAGTTHDDDDKEEIQWSWTIATSRERSQFP